ncbi:5-methylcytosine-specific restriction enzyme B [Candidatus Ornithobacterium hominis]|uniref:5-methylcytosine-specific restriction enzyme B n=1 Tax=Candidatus Ornithobacterium hominis TaxID=2497989 RepID=A0A383U4S7_9FLAO|nr:AAA family ATPase [Candidatus Ornithobacterium hominis]MCT7904695.1 AAA family ATPase [Candidatus Ornithobacterium hominis]SZD73963.1 5-methylcytosine-specific restriction enzyme B [Candidatus Ornithobacterium hominis]
MIKIFKFRKNDLNPSLGKQIEFNQNVVSNFFGFSKDKVEIYITYKSLSPKDTFNNKKFKNYLKLSPSRGDYKVYSNSDETENIKDLFINILKLNETNNLDDYFALIKKDAINYDLYFLPKETSISSFLSSINNSVFEFDTTNDNTVINSNPNAYKPIIDQSLRGIILKTFKVILNKVNENDLLQLSQKKESRLDESNISVLSFPKYFNTDAIISYFNKPQNKEQLKSGGIQRYFDENLNLVNYPNSYLTNQWYDNDKNNTSLLNFNKFLSDLSEGFLKIIKEDNVFKLVSLSHEKTFEIQNNILGYNKIYFGPPGTGKSHAIKEELKKLGAKGDYYSRVTFHPDYDYHSFVGGYKPFTDTEDDDKIKYKFVPQVFIDFYIKAWSKLSEHYYLVIEEINRGNCAEIFGDIFQLLDRNPEYNIEPSTELRAYLEEYEKSNNVKLLFDGKLQMPNNLSILASMNTSDQSLYPMDSAFKRRWDWHYVPIDLKCTESNFTINIDDTHQYSWLEFLAKVNNKIYSVTKSEDKQIGNWFINASKSDNIISKELFINKVLYYLWNDVFKDEVFNPDNIFIERNTDGTKNRNISFNNFYNKDEQDRLLIHLLSDILNVQILKSADKEIVEYSQENQVVGEAAEPNGEEYKEKKSESEE